MSDLGISTRNYLLDDGIGYIQLLDYMGGDKAIVDRARKCYQSQDKSTPESDSRLIKRLVGSKPLHGTTMRNTVFTFDVVAPLFVIRQWTRHIVGHDCDGGDLWHTGGGSFDIGAAFDEQSFRYTGSNLRYYTPSYVTAEQAVIWQAVHESQLANYMLLRDCGFDKQLARCALGPGFYSQMEWTCNLQGLLDWYHKRMPGGGAQPEIIRYAEAAMAIVNGIVPQALQAWRNNL